jgi:hypothetical protein
MSSSVSSFEYRREEHREVATRHGAARFGYVVAIVFNALFFYLFQDLQRWAGPYVTERWVDVLPAITHSLTVAIVFYSVYLFFNLAWFRLLGQVTMNVFAVNVMWRLFIVFPFALGTLRPVLRLALVAGIVGVAIAILIDLVRLLAGRWAR